MTVRTPPTFLQAGSHTAENTRLALRGFFGSPNEAFAGGVQAFSPGHGVHRYTSTGVMLAVGANGTPNMSVNVAPGGAFITGTESAHQGVYYFYSEAAVNLTIDASDPTNARRDLVVAQVRDAAYSGASNDARFLVVKGTPSASPADPALPPNCLVLARVQVNAGATSITGANITDLRTYVRPWNTAWGEVAAATRTSGQTISTTSFVDLTGLSVTFPIRDGRRYRIQAWVRGGGSTTIDGNPELQLTNGANQQLQLDRFGPVTSTVNRWTFSLTHYVSSFSSGTATYKLRARDATGARNWQTIAASDNPATLVVEDIGPA